MACGCGCNKKKGVNEYIDASEIDIQPYEDANSLLALDECGRAIVVETPAEYTEEEKEKVSVIVIDGDGAEALFNDGTYKTISPGGVVEIDPVFTEWKNGTNISIGEGSSETAFGGIAIGVGSQATQSGQTAIGSASIVSVGSGMSVSIGSNSQVLASDYINGTDIYGPLSVGRTEGGKRRIINVANGINPNDVVNVSQIENVVEYDNIGNIELRRGTKILATHPDGSQHELIGVNEYQINGQTYLQSEVGDPAVHLNFNTNNDPNFGVNPSVDTPEGKKIVALFDQGVLFLDAKYFTPVYNGSGGLTLSDITLDEISESYRKYELGLRSLATNKNGFINDNIDYFAVEGNTYRFDYRFALADYDNLLVNVYKSGISAVIGGEVTTEVTLENSFKLTKADESVEYLPLTGGSISGNLHVQGELETEGELHVMSGSYLNDVYCSDIETSSIQVNSIILDGSNRAPEIKSININGDGKMFLSNDGIYKPIEMPDNPYNIETVSGSILSSSDNDVSLEIGESGVTLSMSWFQSNGTTHNDNILWLLASSNTGSTVSATVRRASIYSDASQGSLLTSITTTNQNVDDILINGSDTVFVDVITLTDWYVCRVSVVQGGYVKMFYEKKI